MANLVAKNGLGGGKSLIAVDALGAAKGQMVAFTEGTKLPTPTGQHGSRWMRTAL